jgi:hypothetical protein
MVAVDATAEVRIGALRAHWDFRPKSPGLQTAVGELLADRPLSSAAVRVARVLMKQAS